jgi:hypothetical protein
MVLECSLLETRVTLETSAWLHDVVDRRRGSIGSMMARVHLMTPT